MAVPSPLPTSKSEWRAWALAQRRTFAVSLLDVQRRELEYSLASILWPHLVSAKVVALYCPLPGEISPLALPDYLNVRTVFPWFADRDAEMGWREGHPTEMGPWSVKQPTADATALKPDVVIVPLVLADRRGVRIGHGQGHYDRALADLRQHRRVKAVGVGWGWQIIDDPLPSDPWDMHLEALATPKEWIQCA